MAENENRGGFRPTASQNNPANINGLGGNGQSGMSTDYTGFAYGQNKAVNEQRQAAPIKPADGNARIVPVAAQQLPEVIPLDAPTQRPNQPVTAGGVLGPGGGEDILGLPPISPVMEFDSGINAVRALYLQDPNNQDLKRILEYVDRPGVTS
jgi:hypothetical protein